MECLGFNSRWRGLMMQCISTVTYFVCINGISCGCIVLARGLRQGDLLSPYLFLICAEGLFALIKQFVQCGNKEGFAMCRGGPCVSHLFFADDSLIFCKASLEECDSLQRILKVYEEASGQQLNRAKTSLFLVKTQGMKLKRRLKQDLVPKSFVNMRCTLVFLHWLVETKEIPLMI